MSAYVPQHSSRQSVTRSDVGAPGRARVTDGTAGQPTLGAGLAITHLPLFPPIDLDLAVARSRPSCARIDRSTSRDKA